MHFTGFKHILLAGVSVLSLVTSINLSKWITEHYFFDRLYYQKSIDHGYIFDNTPHVRYGKRAEDNLMLQNFLTQKVNGNSQLVLGINTDDVFTVVVIGDSFLWGQGIRNEERFPVLLEKKLNQTKPSKVISLGQQGYDIYDYYLRYREIQEMLSHIDMYIFVLVDNDILFNQRSTNDTLKTQLANKCDKPILYSNYALNFTLQDNLRHAAYDQHFGNTCLFGGLIPLFPKSDAIYLDAVYYKYHTYQADLLKPLLESGLNVLSPDYRERMTSDKFYVSDAEKHPSATANRMYADVLYKEINRMQELP